MSQNDVNDSFVNDSFVNIISGITDSHMELRNYLKHNAKNETVNDQLNLKLIKLVLHNIDYTFELLKKFEDSPEKISKFLKTDKETTDSFIRYEIIKRNFFPRTFPIN